MRKNFKSKFKNELQKRIPKDKAKIAAIIVIFIIIGFAAWFRDSIFEYVSEKLFAKADVEIVLPERMSGNILPIIIENVGDKLLTKQEVKIKACYSEQPLLYFPSDLKPHEKREIPIDNPVIIKHFSSLDCSDLNKLNFSTYLFSIKVFENTTSGKILIPSQSVELTVCGYCGWDISYSSAQFNKTFNKTTYSPIGLNEWIEGHNFNKNSTEIIPLSPINMTIFDDKAFKVFIQKRIAEIESTNKQQ